MEELINQRMYVDTSVENKDKTQQTETPKVVEDVLKPVNAINVDNVQVKNDSLQVWISFLSV